MKIVQLSAIYTLNFEFIVNWFLLLITQSNKGSIY